MDEPEFNEAELMEKALKSYVEELRERVKHNYQAYETSRAVEKIANEIEGRFLVKFTVDMPVNNEAWREMADAIQDPELEVSIHEVSITPRGLEPGYTVRRKE